MIYNGVMGARDDTAVIVERSVVPMPRREDDPLRKVDRDLGASIAT